jgi:hypothetical protein
MRGGERKEGPPNKERGDGMGDGSLQTQFRVNLHPKRAKNRINVAKGGEADGVALIGIYLPTLPSGNVVQHMYTRWVAYADPLYS